MLRSYRKSDKQGLLHAFKLNTPEFFDEKEVQDYEEYLDEHPNTYFTIMHESEIVGGIGYVIEEQARIGNITWIFIHPEYKGMGLASEAVTHCLNILKANRNAETFVVRTSQLAYEFFEKFGFRLIKASKDYWGKGFDLYLMEQHHKI